MPTLMHELDSASPPNPLQPLECLHTHTALTTPYASAPWWLTILTLLRQPQDMPPMPPSTPLMPPPTHLILSAPYNAYSHVLN
ncbi:hypothetical protein O181_102267 [Austropuccinia psidii MF-1]|uniref:Uncharacterized protein n=1 Tax=Austropuccinia psidii MF-1 TaxID=1389203 RepID=A0A9Q3PJA9_9BASI|nr:hypothetical protein [Austropuccinia psidii MF-1]